MGSEQEMRSIRYLPPVCIFRIRKRGLLDFYYKLIMSSRAIADYGRTSLYVFSLTDMPLLSVESRQVFEVIHLTVHIV